MTIRKFVWLALFGFILLGCQEKTDVPVLTVQEKYVQDHPELSDEMKKTILDEIVTIGMTEAQVKASWGVPTDIEVFSSEYNSYKRWVYKDRPKVYWKDGKVSQLLK